MHSLARRLFPLAVAALLIFGIAGCGKSKSPTQPPTPPTPANCDQLVAQADNALAAALFAEINSDPLRPSDIDFQTPYSLYKSVYAACPSVLRARFGIAVLGLVSLSSDPEVNAAFDEWDQYLASHTPFSVPSTRARPLGIPTGLTRGRDAYRLPFEVVPLSILAHTRAALAAADPQLSRIQAILRDRVLPRVDEAITHLDAVGADASFQFIVTPQMQGDPAASPVEIDRTDVLALRAACDLLAAACHVAVSYQLSFTAYDSVGLHAAIQPGSDWLKIRSDGAGHMSLAQSRLGKAIDDVDLSIQSLRAEQDNQDDDVIRIGPDDLSAAGLDSVAVHLDDARQILTGTWTQTEDWDDNASTPPVALRFRLGRLFTQPVQDWKALLPEYVGTVVRRPGHVLWSGTYGQAKATFTVGDSANYSGSYSLSAYDRGPSSEWPSGDAPIVNGLKSLIQSRYDNIRNLPNWGGDYSAGTSFYGGLSAGLNSVQVYVYENYSLGTDFVAVPVLTWSALTYDAWEWPDPTFDGILPDLTSTSALLTTFGYDPAWWTREVVLDWTGNAAAISGLPKPPMP